MRQQKEISLNDAYERLAKICSSREICESQAVSKMRGWFFSEEECREVLVRLVDEKYIDNRRYTLAFARDKSRFNKWGPQKIKMHLQVKGVEKGIIDEALAEIEVDELPESIIRELMRRKNSVKHKTEYELKMKLIAFVVRKGYNLDIASASVNKIFE